MLSALAAAGAVVVVVAGRARAPRRRSAAVPWADVDALLCGMLVRADLPVPDKPLARWAQVIGITVVSATLLFGTAGVLVGGGIALVVPPMAVGVRGDRTTDQLGRQLPLLLEQLARTTRQGGTINQAVRDAAGTLAEPLAGDMRRVVVRQDAGWPLGAALDCWAKERDTSQVSAVVAAVSLGDRLGGIQSASFDGLAMSLRAQAEVAGEVQALASQAVASAALIGIAPIAFAVVLQLTGTSPISAVVETRLGMLSACVGLTLEGIGTLWMRRIVRT